MIASPKRFTLGALLPLVLTMSLCAQNKRDEAVRKDRVTLLKDESWFYDDFAKASTAAGKQRRPLMVVFR